MAAGDLDIMVIFLVWQQKEGNFKYFLEVPPIVLNVWNLFLLVTSWIREKQGIWLQQSNSFFFKSEKVKNEYRDRQLAVSFPIMEKKGISLPI